MTTARTPAAASSPCAGEDPHPIDDYGHGTHVASTIAEATNNAQGPDRAGLRRDDHARQGARQVRRRRRGVDRRRACASPPITARRSSTCRSSSAPRRRRPREIPKIAAAVRYAPAQGRARRRGRRQHAAPTRRVPGRAARRRVRRRRDRARLPRRLLQHRHRAWTWSRPAEATTPRCSTSRNCRPGAPGRPICQIAFTRKNKTFRYPTELRRHVDGRAARLRDGGADDRVRRARERSPTPAAIERRLKATARDLGAPGPDRPTAPG